MIKYFFEISPMDLFSTIVFYFNGYLFSKAERVFLKLVCCGEKYFQLKSVNIQNNYKNFLVNFWYLNINLLASTIFIGDVVVA